ncbi:MAG: glycosyltransferase [Bauldia sp.]|nr:glycosyltransferase [Bauldia sp.]
MASAREKPRIAVVVVSDYAAGGVKDWDDERLALDTLARQDIAEPFEIVLVENESLRGEVPPGLLDRAPHARIVFDPALRSAQLKDAGVAATGTPLVAVMEADCAPAPDWLRRLAETMDATPEAGIVSGRTTYGGGTMPRRVFALLDRAFMDLGVTGPVPHICNNGALYRRAVLEAHPYGAEPSPFVSAEIRRRAILAAGIRTWFNPDAVMVHRFSGLSFIADLRRNAGLQAARTRLLLGKPKARARAYLSILAIHMRADIRNAKRVGGDYLRPLDWPLWLVMLPVIRALELPGVIRGLRGEASVPGTSYR